MPATPRDAVEGLRAILWRADAQTFDFKWVSHHAEEILGYPVAEWLTERDFLANHVHPEDRDCTVNTRMRATVQGEDHQFGYRAIASDGRIVWLQNVVHVVLDEKGRPSELWGVMVDITERKHAEEALNESESQLRTLFDQLPAAIWTSDRDLRLVSLKGAASRVGVFANLIGKKPSEVTPRNEASEAAHLQAIQGTPATYERTFQGRELQCHVEPLRDRGGNITGVIGVALDITDIKKAQRALQDNETRWQLLCEKSGTAILTVDAASRILSANPAAQQLFGYSEQELKQLTTLQMTHEGDRERTRWIVREMIAGRKNVHRYEKRYRRKDGRIVWVSTTGTLVRDARGAPWFFTLMVEDITQRKRAEAALGRLSARLRRLQDEERKRLAHELHDNTAQSLAALSLNLGVVETSADQLSLPAQQALRDAISLASQSAREIRTFAYLLHPPELEELGLSSALTAYVDGFAQRSGIQIELDMPRKIGALPREFELNVFRIVQESLSNIQRHSRSKTARIRVLQRPKELFLEVINRGSNLSRGTPRSDSYAIGIGIAGMKERARQLGGSLEVVSQRSGTTVKVTVPLPQRKAGEGA